MILFFRVTLIFLVISVSSFAQINNPWKWLSPAPQGNRLNYVKMFDSQNWYACGHAGTFMKTTNGGSSWIIRNDVGRLFATSSQTSNLMDAHFFNQNKGIVIGGSGTISITTDAGNTWNEVTTNPMQPTTTVTLNKIYFANNLLGFICGTSGFLLKTTDGGNNWVTLASGVNTTLYDIWASDENNIFLTTTSGNIRKSTDGGLSWQQINTGVTSVQNRIVNFNSNLITCGASSSVRLSTDFGISWQSINNGLPPSTAFYDIDIINDEIYLTGHGTNIYKTSNLGQSWSEVPFSASNQVWTSSYFSTSLSTTGDSLVTVGTFGLINSKMGTNSSPFVHTQLFKAGTWNDVWSSSPNGTVIVVGAPTSGLSLDQIGRSTDGGITWSIIPFSSNSTASFWSISMINENLGFISGTNSAIYKTTNSGLTWDSLVTEDIPAGITLRKIFFVNENVGWVLASAPNNLPNYIFKTTNGGANWIPQSHGISGSINGTILTGYFVNENIGYICTFEPKPYRTTDGGATWGQQSVVDNYNGFYNDIKMLNADEGYIVGGAGRIYKTTNGGALWDSLTVPTRSFVLNTMEIVDNNTIVAMGNTGVFFISTDAGSTWINQNTSAATLSGSHFSKDNSNNYAFFTVGTNGAILKNTTSTIPVELVNFSAMVNNNDVLLNWETATELNNRGFEVNRKFKNGEWETISFVQGKGNSSASSKYSFIDKSLSIGYYSYRIKQIDLDGTVSLSPEVIIEIENPIKFELSQNFPNPFNASTRINFAIPTKSMVELDLYNSLGEKIESLMSKYLDAGYHTFDLNTNNLSSGVYFYRFKSGSFIQSKKIVLIK